MLKQVQEEVVVGLGFLEVWENQVLATISSLLVRSTLAVAPFQIGLSQEQSALLEEHSPSSKVGAAALGRRGDGGIGYPWTGSAG